MISTLEDQQFMKRALALARKGIGWTLPNPMVGAVIVKNGKIIAQDYHKKAGFPHAEIEALQHAPENVQGATLYVNVEPCSHFGKTPPCVDAIIAAGISRVVCCTVDPNPLVKVQGIKKLHEAGIYVTVGILEQEARQLNEAFFTFHEKKRPFIALKFAASLDGKIATHTGDSKWITNEKARLFARNLRSEYQAILIGINTVMKDNPHLGTRIKGKKDPLRIILDSPLQIPLESQALRDTNVLIATTEKADREKKQKLMKKGIEIISFPDKDRIPIPDLLQELYKRNIISIFVEGGSQVLGSFVDEKLVDKVYAFHAPMIIGGEKAVNAVAGKGTERIADAIKLQRVSFKKFDDTILTIGYPKT